MHPPLPNNRNLAYSLAVFVAQAIVWLVLLIIPFYITPEAPLSANARDIPFGEQEIDFIRRSMFTYTCLMISFFYFNYHFLIPRVLKIRGWTQYVASTTACLVFVLLFYRILEKNIFFWGEEIPTASPPSFFLVFIYLLFLALSSSIRLAMDHFRYEEEKRERENENLKSELSLLRSQVSPHFMFNVLNSLTALARKRSFNLEPAIIQLSKLMRYMLYESNNKIAIEKELEYLGSFISLQKLRFGDTVEVRFDTYVQDKEFVIEPMLLIPFVENAFKHGIGMINNPVIEITLRAELLQLEFNVRNKVSGFAESSKDPSSGIGLSNLRRRLKLLYPSHHIVTEYENGWYYASLTIFY